MADVEMTVYDSIYELTSVMTWASEEEYRRAAEFLISIGASRVPPPDAVDQNADFYLSSLRQTEDSGRYYHRVVEARPKIGPPRLDMRYYAGDGGYITWANEDEYQQAKKFLSGIGVENGESVSPRYENPESLFFDTTEQYQAFIAFARSILEKRPQPPSLDMAFFVDWTDRDSVTWVNEDEYQKAKQFLLSVGAKPDWWPFSRYGDPKRIQLSKAQYQAFLEFKKSIEEERKA
jgi:hypothetical protein